MDSLRKLRIGALHGSASLQQLKERQLPNITVATNHSDLWRMLDKGVIDVAYGGRAILFYELNAQHYDIQQFRFGLVLETGPIWLAGGPGFTAADVAIWSKALLDLKKEGAFSRVLRKYGLPE